MTNTKSIVGILKHLGHLERRLLASKSIPELQLDLERRVSELTWTRVGVQNSSWALTCKGTIAISPRVGETLVYRHLVAKDTGDDRGAATAAGSTSDGTEKVDESSKNADDVREARSIGWPPPSHHGQF